MNTAIIESHLSSDFENADLLPPKEIDVYAEYAQIARKYKFSVETERRLYLCNEVDLQAKNIAGQLYFEVTIDDGWVLDSFRNNRKISHAKVITFKDVNIEEIQSIA